MLPGNTLMTSVFIFDEFYNRCFFIWSKYSKMFFLCFEFWDVPSNLRSMVPLSLIRGNNPVFNAAYPLLLFSWHHFTALESWSYFSSISFLFTTASAFELGFPETETLLLTLKWNFGFDIIYLYYTIWSVKFAKAHDIWSNYSNFHFFFANYL